MAPTGAADTTKYHTYAELSAALKAAVTAHPNLATLVSIGKSAEGRDIWAIEIANASGTPVDQRPGLLIAANFEGDHVIGSELAVYLADYLLTSYASDAAVKQRLDNHVFYIVPRVNPDGAELMFAPVKTGRRTNGTKFDADNDGRIDEDGPEDLNKDGFITVMRVKDPKGPYMIHPDDARLMKRADPAKGETGGYAIYWEGTDKDRDGFIAEDGPGGTDINRNFMHQYPYFQTDAGRYMVSESETRAMLDYVIKHRNIAAMLTFGENDNLISTRAGAANPINLLDFAERSVADSRRVGIFPEISGGFGRGGRGGGGGMSAGGDEGGPGGRGGQQAAAAGRGGGRGGAVAATTVNPADAEYINAIVSKYREFTGLRSTGYTRAPAGAFYEYGYYQYGVPSFSTPGWGLPGAGRPAGAGAPGGDTGRGGTPPAGMTAGAGAGAGRGRGGAGGGGAMSGGGGSEADFAEGIDLRLLQWMDGEKIDGFVKWTPFKHPTLGEVEIGGFKPYATTNPPVAKIADLGASHAKFVLYLTSIFPKVKIAKAEATALGGGIYRIRADVENTGYLPTAMAQGVVARSVKPIMVQLGVPPESIITGNEKTNHLNALAGSGTRQSYEWVIKGKPAQAVTLKVVSQKSGTDTATITLQ
ncbi:MAG: M14 family metallopeptidase [Acidobacteria bacterium]|nr:M14 family metallopeptidase [Acidobacteriota bacterium]